MPTLSAKIRAARTGLGMSQQMLAHEAGVHVNTVRKIEGDRDVGFAYILDCLVALEARGIEFLEVGGRHGLILPATLSFPGASALRAARAALVMDRPHLAEIASVSEGTAARLEDGVDAVGDAYLRQYLTALASQGLDIITLEEGVALMLPPLARLRSLAAARLPVQ